MKNIYNYLIIIVILLTVTSCFEITEEVSLRKDGTGIYVSTTDATKALELTKMVGDEAKQNLKSSLDSIIIEYMENFKSMKGISSVKLDTSKPFVYRISMNFNNIAALNNAISNNNKETRDAYTWQIGKLTRMDMPFGIGVDDFDQIFTDDDSQKEQIKSMLSDLKYTMIWKFPTEIKSMTNKGAELNTDKKSAILKVNFFDIIDKKVSIYNEITY